MSTLIGLIPIVLTILVFSRILGDNPLFRAIQYLFVGLSLGFAFVVVYHQVLASAVVDLLANANDPLQMGMRLAPFVLGLLFLPRLIGRQSFSWLANIPLGLLFGVGAALALGGAFVGTLWPQLIDTSRPTGSSPLQLGGMALLALGVIMTLMYFYFTIPRDTPRGRIVALGAQCGRWLLMAAFGFFFAGALLTYITALNERLEFIVNWAGGLLS
jgi:hypothetical protein